MGLDPSATNDNIIKAIEGARIFKLCPRRIWAIAGSLPNKECNLPELIPQTGKTWVRGHGEGDDKHDHCTFDFCEYSRIDYTSVEQRHECPGNNCTDFRSFSPLLLKETALAGDLTASKLDGETMIKPPEPFMAISHV
jgi:hypothetical protein